MSDLTERLRRARFARLQDSPNPGSPSEAVQIMVVKWSKAENDLREALDALEAAEQHHEKAATGRERYLAQANEWRRRAEAAEADRDALREALKTIRSKVKRIDTLLALNEPTTEESFALPLKLCSRLLEFIGGLLPEEQTDE